MKSYSPNFDLTSLREASSPKPLMSRPNNNQAISSDHVLHGSTSARNYKPPANIYQSFGTDTPSSKNASKMKNSFSQYSNITVKQMITAGLTADIKVGTANHMSSGAPQLKKAESSTNNSYSRNSLNGDRKPKSVVKSYINLAKDYSISNSHNPRNSLASQAMSKRDSKLAYIPPDTNSNTPSTSFLPKSRSYLTSETPTNGLDSSPTHKISSVNPGAYRLQLYKSPEREDDSASKKLDFENFSGNTRTNEGSARKKGVLAMKSGNKQLTLGQMEENYGKTDVFFSPTISPTSANAGAKEFHQKIEQILTKANSQKGSFIMHNSGSQYQSTQQNSNGIGHEFYHEEPLTSMIESRTTKGYKSDVDLQKTVKMSYRTSQSPSQMKMPVPGSYSGKTRQFVKEIAIPEDNAGSGRKEGERERGNNSVEGRVQYNYQDEEYTKKILSESPVKRGMYKPSAPMMQDERGDESLNTSHSRTHKMSKGYTLSEASPSGNLAEVISFKQIRLGKGEVKKYPATTKNSSSNVKKFDFTKVSGVSTGLSGNSAGMTGVSGNSGNSQSLSSIHSKTREKVRMVSPNANSVSVIHLKDLVRDGQSPPDTGDERYGGSGERYSGSVERYGGGYAGSVERYNEKYNGGFEKYGAGIDKFGNDKYNGGNGNNGSNGGFDKYNGGNGSVERFSGERQESGRMVMTQETNTAGSIMEVGGMVKSQSRAGVSLQDLGAIFEKTRAAFSEQKRKEQQWGSERVRMMERISELEGRLRAHEEVEAFQL